MLGDYPATGDGKRLEAHVRVERADGEAWLFRYEGLMARKAHVYQVAPVGDGLLHIRVDEYAELVKR